MRIEPEISGVSVVLLGNFNPAIFTPAWFALHGLLPERTAENAETKIVHSGVTAFSTEWLELDVTTDRFRANTLRNPYIRVRDLLVRVFKEHLSHTPLKALGINRDVHFRVGQAERNKLGKLLAPVKPWGRWKNELGLDSDYGGMTSLTMTQYHPLGRPRGGQINVTVEPSNRIDNGRSGIYVRINDHYEIASGDIAGHEQLMGFLEDDFEMSIQRSNDIVDHIMSLKTVQEKKDS